MSRRRGLYLALALLLAAAFVTTQFQLQPDERVPGEIESILSLATRDDLNIVFILVDTLRADRLGTYGYERETSPSVYHLARAGIRFAKLYEQ